MRGETTRLAARGSDDIDLLMAFGIGVERDRLPVGRPARGACAWSAHGGELEGARPIGIGQPDFGVSGAIRYKRDPLAVWRKLGVRVPPRGGDGDRGRRGGWGAGSRSLDAPDIPVIEAADVNEPKRPARLGAGNDRPQPVLAHEGEPRRRAVAGDRQPPQTSPGGEENFLTVGHPRRMAGVQRGEGETPGFAAGGQTFPQRKPVQLSTGACGEALEHQRTAVRRDHRVGIVESGRLRIRQLPFLSRLEGSHEQGVRLSFSLEVREDQTVAVGTPGNVRGLRRV